MLARLNDVPVGLEERADVERLAPPYVAVDGPVEGELQGASVEGAARESVELADCSGGRGCAQHDGLVARHCCFRREAAARSCCSNWVGDASDGVRGGRGRCRTLLWLPCSMVGRCWLGVAARDVPGRDALTSGRLSGSAFVTGLVRK